MGLNPIGVSECFLGFIGNCFKIYFITARLESSLSLVLYSLDLSVVLDTTGGKSVDLFSLTRLKNKPMSLSGEKNIKDTGHARGGD